ncbi:MAG: glutamate racemase [Spirochaetes bacterium GWF1_51_8]|nr:MAG: glutamate racemase [Spirochaetes bacterium GWF1_51_8]
MDKRPIGIFDSGVGGLTVAKEVMNLLPNETIVYLGDTANLPYGEKSAEIIRHYSVDNTEFLLKHDIKMLVVACNTASSVALEHLKSLYTIPIVGVIEPAVKGAIFATRNKKIGVIGTNRTIKSNVYAEMLAKLEPEGEIHSRSCPLFVPLIEEFFVEHDATRLIAAEYLKEFKEQGADTLILGCTHYPLIKEIIAEILPGVKLVDSAFSTARDIHSLLDTHKMLALSPKDGKPKHRFFATDLTPKLNELAKYIIGSGIDFEEISVK